MTSRPFDETPEETARWARQRRLCGPTGGESCVGVLVPALLAVAAVIAGLFQLAGWVEWGDERRWP